MKFEFSEPEVIFLKNCLDMIRLMPAFRFEDLPMSIQIMGKLCNPIQEQGSNEGTKTTPSIGKNNRGRPKKKNYDEELKNFGVHRKLDPQMKRSAAEDFLDAITGPSA